METPYTCIATPLDRNFLIIGGVARSQTKRCISTMKCTVRLKLINHTQNSTITTCWVFSEMVTYSALISQIALYKINSQFDLPCRKFSLNCHTYSMFCGIHMCIRCTTTPTNCWFVRVSWNRRLGDGNGYNYVRNGGYDPWLSRIRNCGMPRLKRSTTVPEKQEIFVIHMLSL